MKPKCAITGICCPKTNDPTEKVYCPHWVEGIPETEQDNSGRFVERIYRGCFLSRLPQYLVSIAAGAGHASASYDKAATFLQQAESEPTIRAVLTLGLSSLAGRVSTASCQIDDGDS